MATPVLPASIPRTGLKPTARLSENQSRAQREAKGMQDSENHSAISLSTQDRMGTSTYMIYVYNILDREHVVNQPPLFPAFRIPARARGEKFAYTVLPAFVNLPYEKPGTTDRYYELTDGRKCATSLLNPSAFPGIKWESQIQNWDSLDQTGNNLNKFGVFWSLTPPDELEHLEEELKIFNGIVNETMDALVKEGEQKAASGELKLITPWMHYAMDYFGKQAQWHMSSVHMVACPNCGENVKEGIAYHRNSFGEKCVIDIARYKMMMQRQKEVDAALAADETTEENEERPRPKRKVPAAS